MFRRGMCEYIGQATTSLTFLPVAFQFTWTKISYVILKCRSRQFLIDIQSVSDKNVSVETLNKGTYQLN